MYHSGHPLSAVSRMDVQLTSKSSSHQSPLPSSSPHLCEDGRTYVTDPITGRQVCMCNLMATPEMHYPRMNMGPETRKQGSIPGVGGPQCLGYDTSAFCSPVLRGLPIRQDRIPPYLTSGLPGQGMTFDPTLAGHPYGLLYSGMDVNGPMRKAATRETTGPLKAWLSDHKKNPYPTKAEKIMLAIITRMTLTQVSTWFANARRRLKKDNRLTSGDGEEDSMMGLDSDRDGDSVSIDVSVHGDEDIRGGALRTEGKLSSEGEADQDSFSDISDEESDVFRPVSRDKNKHADKVPVVMCPLVVNQSESAAKPQPTLPGATTGKTHPEKPKPKIWSISHILDS